MTDSPAAALQIRGTRPRLLVSVRNADEAEDAVAGGCQLLDLKEPLSGSLGMVAPEVMQDVASWLERRLQTGPSVSSPVLSVALGELTEWPAHRTPPELPEQVQLAKLGLAGCGNDAGWRNRWLQVRERIEQSAAGTPAWVAVCYADYATCNAPAPAEILQAAVDTSCTAILLDTFHKDGCSLIDHLPIAELAAFLKRIQAAGLVTAVAGSVKLHQLEALATCRPAIIAVRTAACAEQSRTSRISRENVLQLASALSRLPDELRE